MKLAVAAFALLTTLAAAPLHAQTQPSGPSREYNGEFVRPRPAEPQSTDRIIIKWRSTGAKAVGATARAQKASAVSGLAMSPQQKLTDDIEVMQSPRPLSGAALDQVIERLEADPAVAYAVPALRKHAHALTSDPFFTQQWYFLGDQPAATRTNLAWDITQGSASIVIAVIDTGVRFDHTDLLRATAGGKLLDGYDFVSRTAFANDGDGRDADASDPGDFVTSGDLQQPGFGNCELKPKSSWHGTRVASLVGALTDNAVGIAGGAWNTSVLPVRVLSKCGGFDDDIIAGMRWAAGLPVAGAPINPTPAKIINLSLGGEGLCSSAYQDTVDEIVATGALLVISAGNEGGPVASPANCIGVLGVAGLRHIGTKVGFSNVGTEIGIGAPGGNCVNTGSKQPCLFSIVAATDEGMTTPVAPSYTDEINYNIGTSFSAPLTAAAAALMKSVNSALTPAQIITLLQRSAAPFPVSTAVAACHVPVSASDLQDEECNCTTSTCGAGMLDTNAAVNAAQRPFAIATASGTVTAGSSVTIKGSSSFASNGRSVVAYQWSIVNAAGAAPTIVAPAQAETSLQIVDTNLFTLRLTVTDDHGAQGTQDITLGAAPAPPPVVTPPATNSPVASSSGGGGGGGAMGLDMLASLALLLGLLARTRVRSWRGRFRLAQGECPSSGDGFSGPL